MPEFDREGFVRTAADGLEDLELRDRSRQITAALVRYLPENFEAAADVIAAALHPEEEAVLSDMATDDRGIRGWAIMPIGDFVAERGMGDFDRAMDLLRDLTKRFSSEFAVRPFIVADEARAMEHVRAWAQDTNFHVRRLASEGSRPRLPWGIRLNTFVRDPAPVLPVLEMLRDDPEEYVRRSVANNLNDIAKDHPDLVAGIAAEWMEDAGKNRARLVKHACRTLIKQGHPATLKALGYGPAQVDVSRFWLASDVVEFGTALEFRFDMNSRADEVQDIILDYQVHYVKANGSRAPKVFKLKVLKLPPGETVSISKRHAMRPITTRRFNSGTHRVEILANGAVLAGLDFELTGV